MSPHDPRSPFVIELRELGRRPGSVMTVDRVITAPADLAVALARIPEGADLALHAQCESAGEGVWVTGTVDFTVAGECARCLEPLTWPQEASFAELFAYPPTDARGARVEVDDDDEEESRMMVEDDCINLEPVIRDAVVLGLPMAPLCREECAGLCPTCGVRLEAGDDHRHEETDPRWDALRALTSQIHDETMHDEKGN